MNVLAKCWRHFPAAIKQPNGEYHRHPSFKVFLEEWNALLEASIVDVFNKALAAFRTLGRHLEAAVAYVLNTWIDPWKVGPPPTPVTMTASLTGFKEKLVKY